MRRPRIPSADEAALWHTYVKDVAPLPRGAAETAKPVPPPPPAPPAARPAATAPSGKPRKPARTVPAPVASVAPLAPKAVRMPPVMQRPLPKPDTRRADRSGPVDIDRRTWQRLHRGELIVEARLDLHGMTQIAAYDRLAAFIDHAWRVGVRCVLVITGRGSASRGSGDVGILRTMTPRWLDEIPMRDKVLAYTQAKTHHGGAGALYVLIRRRRLALPPE